ncbi:DUF2326 domain-containing protein [Microscilla marina]|uniref:DUF2326 domain-containing protein n=1 Tax=Microscilla marina ATCC 23134 TaxID=313606 RepID=A1ZY05_MICM2|nr:DUF2326 domain-containing protein [Microscilla marina]EAY24742.1 conserved hypothetical protein [Microscilla marina ATCC 23134]
MIKLEKLYAQPEIFEPISFDWGINIIVGERSEDSNKTNGVGKSMSIEFIQFCLFKDFKRSRISKIPANVLAKDTEIFLNLRINEELVTIIRSVKEHNQPKIVRNQQTTQFSSIADAVSFLEHIIFQNQTHKKTPSLRKMVGLLIRDEGSEFKDIINYYDTNLRVSKRDLYEPHLYLFGIDIYKYQELQEIIKNIDEKKGLLKELKKQVTNNGTRKISDAKADLNGLKDKVEKLENQVEILKTADAFESIQDDLIRLQREIDHLRSKQDALKYEIKKIETLPEPEIITETDITILYNQFKSGLGDIINKSLDEVKSFKNKIDSFQKMLINERYSDLKSKLAGVTKKLRELDDLYAQTASPLDKKGIMKDLKTALSTLNEKNKHLLDLRLNVENLENADQEKKRLVSSKTSIIEDFDNQISKIKNTIDNFNQTILNIHEKVLDNKKAFFEITVKNKSNVKEVFNFEMRVFDDGSHSVNKMKVFMYDMALLFNSSTREKHLKFLIHDNILEVDQDTTIKVLNFLNEQEERFSDFQYILTINTDKIEYPEISSQIDLDIDSHRIARFTKNHKFLKTNYTQI